MIKHFMVATAMWFSINAAFPLYAQQHKDHTLGNLWPKVEESYPGVGAKTMAIDAARFSERAVKSNMLPQVKAQGQNTYGTYEGSPGAFFPQAGFFNVSGATNAFDGSSMTANSFGSATLEWELFSFGKLHKENQAARALSHKAMSEKEAYLLSLKKVLSERYISLLYNGAKLKWTEKNAERLDEIRNITSGLSAAGLRPAADSLLASSSYNQAMGEHDKWSGLEKAAFLRLLELYGGDTVDYAVSASRFTNPIEKYPTGKAISKSHPILQALDQQSQYYSLSAQVQKRSSMPSLRLLGGYAYRGTGINPNGAVSDVWKDGFNNTAGNVLAGIGITWNISSLHTNGLKSKAFYKEAESTKLLHTQYGQAMQADLSASRAKILHQYEQLQKTKLAVSQSREAYGMYLARYRSGIIALSELLQIRTMLEQAENIHIEASRDYWMLLAYEAELAADFGFLFNNL